MWYSVEALFLCDTAQQENAGALYERSIFLIEVASEDQVREKAQRTAQSFEVDYKNCEKDDVRWKFIKILDVQDLCEEELYDGVEVFSRMLNGPLPDDCTNGLDSKTESYRTI